MHSPWLITGQDLLACSDRKDPVIGSGCKVEMSGHTHAGELEKMGYGTHLPATPPSIYIFFTTVLHKLHQKLFQHTKQLGKTSGKSCRSKLLLIGLHWTFWWEAHVLGGKNWCLDFELSILCLQSWNLSTQVMHMMSWHKCGAKQQDNHTWQGCHAIWLWSDKGSFCECYIVLSNIIKTIILPDETMGDMLLKKCCKTGLSAQWIAFLGRWHDNNWEYWWLNASPLQLMLATNGTPAISWHIGLNNNQIAASPRLQESHKMRRPTSCSYWLFSKYSILKKGLPSDTPNGMFQIKGWIVSFFGVWWLLCIPKWVLKFSRGSASREAFNKQKQLWARVHFYYIKISDTL